jgi:hypothetical protein
MCDIWEMRRFFLAGSLAAVVGCGPERAETGTDGEQTGSSSATGDDSTTGGVPTTGDPTVPGACAPTVGPLQPTDDDPRGCYGLTEHDCMAKPADCIENYGTPVKCEVEWCQSGPKEFLGCRPFVICKEAELLVCRKHADGIEVFWSERCVPPGYAPCEPGGSIESPPACEATGSM